MLKRINACLILLSLFLTATDLNAGKKRKKKSISSTRKYKKNKKQKIENDDEISGNDNGEIDENNNIIIDDNDNINNNNNNIIDTNDLNYFIREGNSKLNSAARYEFNDTNETVVEFDPVQGIRVFTKTTKNPEFTKQDPIFFNDFEIGQKVLVFNCGHCLSLDETTVDDLIQKLKRIVRSIEKEYPCPSCRALIDPKKPGHIIELGSDVEFMRFLTNEVPEQFFEEVYQACRNQEVPENWNALIDRFFRSPETRDIARALLKFEKNLTQDYVDGNGNTITLLSFFMQQQEDCFDEVNFIVSHYSQEDLLEIKDNSPLSIALQSNDLKHLEMIFKRAELSSNKILDLLRKFLQEQSSPIQKNNILFLISQLTELDNQARCALFDIFVSYVQKINRRVDHKDIIALIIDKIGEQNVYELLLNLNNAILLNSIIDALFYAPECKDLVLKLINSDQCKPYLAYSVKSYEKNSQRNLLFTAVMTDSSWAIAPILNKCGNPRNEVLDSNNNYADCSICNLAIKLGKIECLEAIFDFLDLSQDDYIDLLRRTFNVEKEQEIMSLIVSKLRWLNDKQKVNLFEVAAERARSSLCSSARPMNLINDEIKLIDAILKKIGRLDLLKFDDRQYGKKFDAFKSFFPASDYNKESEIIHPKILKLFLQYRLQVTNGCESRDNVLFSFLDYYRFTRQQYAQDFLECIELLLDYGVDPEKKVAISSFHRRIGVFNEKWCFSALDIFEYHFKCPDSISLWHIKDPLKAQIYSTLKQHKKRKPEYFDENENNMLEPVAIGAGVSINNNNNNNNNNSIDDDNNGNTSWCVIS